MWLRRTDRSAVADLLGESGTRGSFSRWVYGVFAAAGFAVYGIVCLATQHAVFLSRYVPGVHSYEGSAAVACGIIYLAIGLFLHAHCLLCTSQRTYAAGEVAKIAALLGIVIGVGKLFVAVMI